MCFKAFIPSFAMQIRHRTRAVTLSFLTLETVGSSQLPDRMICFSFVIAVTGTEGLILGRLTNAVVFSSIIKLDTLHTFCSNTKAVLSNQ